MYANLTSLNQWRRARGFCTSLLDLHPLSALKSQLRCLVSQAHSYSVLTVERRVIPTISRLRF